MSYQNAKTIIGRFNYSVQKYNESCIGSPNDNDSIQALDTAGERLYAACEAALKHILYNYWNSQYQAGKISLLEFNAKQQMIEQLDRNSLIRDLESLLAANELTKKQNIRVDFNIIIRNARVVTNKNKHLAQHVDKNAYLISLSEIRKLIHAFIQPDADLEDVNSEGIFHPSQAFLLLKKWDWFAKNKRWNYVLLIDDVSSLSPEQKKTLLFIDWAIILDTDPRTCENEGLLDAFVQKNGYQPNVFSPLHPERTDLSEASSAPFWYHLNGISSLPESQNDGTVRNYRQKNRKFSDAIEKYHAKFPKGIRILVFSTKILHSTGNTEHESFIADEVLKNLDTIYGNDMEIVFTNNRQRELVDSYGNTVFISLEPDELARTMLPYSSQFQVDSIYGSCLMPSKENTIAVMPERYPHLELVHRNIGARELANEEEIDPQVFYKGSVKLSWYGAHQGFAVSRSTFENTLSKKIQSLENKKDFVIVEHGPGAGGTTFLRTYAYKKRTEYPTVIIRQYSRGATARQLSNLYSDLRKQLLVLSDSSILTRIQIDSLYRELKAESFPFVLIYMKRASKKHNDLRIPEFDDFEFDEMTEKLRKYISDNDYQRVVVLKKKPSLLYRTPFFMSLTAFDAQFTAITPYISRFFCDDSMTEEQKRLLLYISLADKFANRSVCVNAFPGLLTLLGEEGYDENSIEYSSSIEDLVVLDCDKAYGNTDYRIRHPLLAEEIIKQCLYQDKTGAELSAPLKASNLVECLIQLINDSKINTVVDYDVTLDLLRNLFIERSESALNRDRFSPLITAIQDFSCGSDGDTSGINRIGRIFKKLVDTYPEDPHFKAHLSRYYTYIELNYNKGVETALEAVEIQQNNTGYDDPVLLHIYGMSLSKRVTEFTIRCIKTGELDLEEGIDKIQKDADDALDAFAVSVESSNNPSAGYSAAIDLCIRILDFAKEIHHCETAEELFKQSENGNQWFFDYLDEATTLLGEWKAEDDSEYEGDTDQESKPGDKKKRDSDDKGKLQSRLDLFYGDLESLNRTIAMWQIAVEKSDSDNIVLRRRLLAQAKQKRVRQLGYGNVSSSEIDEIMHLAEQNIAMEPRNGANIRIWFDAVRHCSSMDPEKLLDYALDKLDTWKTSTGKMEAYYYYFVCTCIKAYEGSSKCEAAIPSLEQELRIKSQNRPDNRSIHEWLGKGKGLQRLIRFRGFPVPLEDFNRLETIGGIVTAYKNIVNATVRSHGMNIFFNPSRAKPKLGSSVETKKVSLCVGFSYDGVRAYDQTVVESTNPFLPVSTNVESPLKIRCGDRVKCRVSSISHQFYIDVKLTDYPEQYGSIHYSKIGSGYTNENRPPVDSIVYATVIGEKTGKYWPLSMIEATSDSTSRFYGWKEKDGKLIKSV